MKGKKMTGKGSKMVGRKVGTTKARKEMLQHDRKVESKGSMGYGRGVKPPKTSDGGAKSRLKRLESAKL